MNKLADKREFTYFVVAMVLGFIVAASAMAGAWEVFAPASLGTVGWLLARAEVKQP